MTAAARYQVLGGEKAHHILARKITLHYHAKLASFHIISHKIWHKYFNQKCFDQTLGKGLKKLLLHAATVYHP